MRNCYVYGCDRRHKDDPKRAMFIVPKDPEKFEEWRQVLPAHRPLRSHDRVCEKHFKPEEIQRDWTYQIGGHTKKLMRAKPVLLPDAIPSIFDSVPPVDRKGTKSRRKQPREPPEEQREVVVVVEQPNQDNDIICVEQTAMVVVIEDESTDVANQPPTAVECNEVEMFQAKPDAAARESIFEELYDNIYEVELPSTLWGVHREPDRKFAAFSRFGWCPGEKEDAVRSVSLLIDCSLACRAWYCGKPVLERDISAKLAPKSGDAESTVRFNIIIELLDRLEDMATEKGSTDVGHVKKLLELCLAEESSNPLSANNVENDVYL